jgi:putative chitinase
MLAAGVAQPKIDTYLAPLNAACKEFNIATPMRLAFFLTTVTFESEEMKYAREVWGPDAAQLGYEGRSDLGNTQPGDGFKFRGGGLIEITGRYNFQQMSTALFGDSRLVDNPDSITDPLTSCRAAGCFWFRRKCNEAADIPDFVRVTRLVNGGTNGLAMRQQILFTVQKAMGIL